MTDDRKDKRDFWNQRYATNEYVYGMNPNHFFKEIIDAHPPGKILLPAEGEGRNAVYAAQKGWQVDAFDFSEEAQKKALQLAARQNVHINYRLLSLDEIQFPPEYYDAVGIIYVHAPVTIRRDFHQRICQTLKEGGFLVMEVFSKEQIRYNSGGPPDIELLYTTSELAMDFAELSISQLSQLEVELREGPYHRGKANVIRLLAFKLKRSNATF